jgi:hypothetical protein
MGHGYGPLPGRGLAGRQFKDGAEIVGAAVYGSAVEVTCLIDGQCGGNSRPFTEGQSMQEGVGPAATRGR